MTLMFARFKWFDGLLAVIQNLDNTMEFLFTLGTELLLYNLHIQQAQQTSNQDFKLYSSEQRLLFMRQERSSGPVTAAFKTAKIIPKGIPNNWWIYSPGRRQSWQIFHEETESLVSPKWKKLSHLISFYLNTYFSQQTAQRGMICRQLWGRSQRKKGFFFLDELCDHIFLLATELACWAAVGKQALQLQELCPLQ